MHFSGWFCATQSWPAFHQSFFPGEELYLQYPKCVMSGETTNVLLWHPEEHTGIGSCFFFKKKKSQQTKQSLKANQIKQTNKNNTKKNQTKLPPTKNPPKNSSKPLSTRNRLIFLELETSLAYCYSLVQIHKLMQNISCTLHPMCDFKSGLNSY